VIAPEVREDDDAHFVMVHDGMGDDVVEGGGGEVTFHAILYIEYMN
jgi:hypothetical protein